MRIIDGNCHIGPVALPLADARILADQIHDALESKKTQTPENQGAPE